MFEPTMKQLQVRWKRRDGNKAFDRPRKVTKKQRKAYSRQLAKEQAEKDKHGTPGSKAGIRREFSAALREQIVYPEHQEQDELDPLEYDMGDALLDDLMGNTSDMSSTPTPEPVYLGHMHRRFHNRVADQMEEYLKNTTLTQETSSPSPATLPTDQDISLALRAYRDRNGTRRNPIGIVKALEYLLHDLKVPLSAFEEYTYTTLLTCSQTPTEARRIFQLMTEHLQPISAYSWSILADVYSKVGDVDGCASVLVEMAREGGISPPPLAAYTSLLAACTKVVNDGGRVPHSIRAAAGDLGWEKWCEMRIVGVEPDVMAYGAILRLCAARGHAERCMNLLEEMPRFNIKPTTLCYTSALHAVAKSHAIALRYERGASKRHDRRAFLTHHHGVLAQRIVIEAESAEVEQDTGFVSALMRCASIAGDLATVKAIHAASQVRNQLGELRPIGSKSHLAQLRGEKPDLVYINSQAKSFGEREYGRDSRVLSALLHACSTAADTQTNMGTMWQGRENKGYLCENSLRLIKARRVPQYTDQSIPGQGRTDNLTWKGGDLEGQRSYKAKDIPNRQRKFLGVHEDFDSEATLDELDEKFSRMFTDKDGRRLKEFQATTPDDIWKLKYGEDDELINQLHGDLVVNDTTSFTQVEERHRPALPASGYDNVEVRSASADLVGDKIFDELSWDDLDVQPATIIRSKEASRDTLTARDSSSHSPTIYFDMESRSWKEGSPSGPTRENNLDAVKKQVQQADGAEASQGITSRELEKELYFDMDERRWMTRAKGSVAPTSYESRVLSQGGSDKDQKVSRCLLFSSHTAAFTCTLPDTCLHIPFSGSTRG